MAEKKKNAIKRRSIKKRIHETKKAADLFFQRVSEDELHLNKFYKKIVNTIKVFVVSTKKFLADDCLTKASSISYTTVISLIPTLAVALTVYSIFKKVGANKEELFRGISFILLENNIKLNVDPIFSSISSLIDNAGKIGGISAAIMIFSATAMLRSLEKSLNSIWKVKKH